MAARSILLILVLGISILPFGYGLKCYVYDCTSVPGKTCAPRREITCAQTPGDPVIPNRCIAYRMTMEIQPGITVSAEKRNCSNSFMCHPRAFCAAANTTGMIKTCEMGCCEGDLCNGGPIPTLPPKPTGPAGSDLTCYSCSTVPMSPGASCSSPINQTCGIDPLTKTTQDRCFTMTMKVKVPGTSMILATEKRNCSTSYYCSPDICKQANTTGIIAGCDISCCFGNLCNDGSSTTTMGPTIGPISTVGSTNRTSTGTSTSTGTITTTAPDVIGPSSSASNSRFLSSLSSVVGVISILLM